MPSDMECMCAMVPALTYRKWNSVKFAHFSCEFFGRTKPNGFELTHAHAQWKMFEQNKSLPNGLQWVTPKLNTELLLTLGRCFLFSSGMNEWNAWNILAWKQMMPGNINCLPKTIRGCLLRMVFGALKKDLRIQITQNTPWTELNTTSSYIANRIRICSKIEF